MGRMTYTHQGWLTEDKKYFLMDDELISSATSTFIIDVSNLEAPFMSGRFCQNFTSMAHNQYVVGNYSYQANYRAGLRILDIEPFLEDAEANNLEEIGFFDVYPEDNDYGSDGSWGNYPWFESGVVVVNSIFDGIFMVTPHFNYNSSLSVRDLQAIIVNSPHQYEDDNKKGQSMHVSITIHDHTDTPVDRALVTGAFYNGIKKSSCITDMKGKCVIESKRLSGRINDITFNVHGVVLPRHRYNKKANVYTSIRMIKQGETLETIKSKTIPKQFRKKSNLWMLSKIMRKLNNMNM